MCSDFQRQVKDGLRLPTDMVPRYFYAFILCTCSTCALEIFDSKSDFLCYGLKNIFFISKEENLENIYLHYRLHCSKKNQDIEVFILFAFPLLWVSTSTKYNILLKRTFEN